MNETKIVKNGTFARCLKYVVAKECEMKGEENNERIFNHHPFIFFLGDDYRDLVSMYVTVFLSVYAFSSCDVLMA